MLHKIAGRGPGHRNALTIADRATGRQNNYAFLRFLAASLVVVSHSYYLALGTQRAERSEPLHLFTRGHMSLGSLGLSIFFVVSGFLVTQSFERRRRVLAYLKARALRIFPALVVVVVLTVFCLGPALTSWDAAAYFRAPGTYAYLTNVFLVHPVFVLPGVFAHNPYPFAVNGPLWTLRYEFAFYIVVAALGVLGLLRRRRVIVVAAVAGCIVASTVLDSGDLPGTVLQSLRLFSWFGMGTLFYLYRSRVRVDARFAALALATLLVTARVGMYDPAFVVAGAYLVMYVAYAPALRLHGWGRYGDFSYGLYLCAFPIQQTAAQLLGDEGTVLSVLLVSYPLALGLAVLSWHLVERPCLALKDVPLRSRLRERRPKEAA